MAQPTSTARALGEPEWWTNPGNTGRQLLEDGAFAAEFMAEETFADIREIRRIVFRMLGMDHLVFFLDACCSHLRPISVIYAECRRISAINMRIKATVHAALTAANTPEEKRIITMKAAIEAANVKKMRQMVTEREITAAIAAKKSAFNEDNIRRLLWFALECGLNLGPTARHTTILARYNRGIQTTRLNVHGTPSSLTTVEMLIQARLLREPLNSAVVRVVLDCATFDVGPIFDENKTMICESMRLHVDDSSSAVWFDVLDMLFAYHQSSCASLSTMDIMKLSLHKTTGKITHMLIRAHTCDKQHRMLPWLLRKPDLNDGSLILRFCRNPIDEIEQIIACAELCKAHQGWSRTCVQLISMFARYEQFVANVNRLLGVNVELTSHADVVAYLFANMKIADVRVIGCDLMQFIVIHAVFDTKLSVDWVFEWMVDVTPNPPRSYFISKLMCIFAQHLFLIRPVNERLVIYKRFRAAFPQRQHHDEIIYYLLHGENAAGTYGPVPPQCSLQIVLEMRVIECEDHVIAYIIDALHSHELVVISRSNALDLIFRLFERKLRFDLLMLLVNRHHPGEMCEWEACDFVDALKLADYEH